MTDRINGNLELTRDHLYTPFTTDRFALGGDFDFAGFVPGNHMDGDIAEVIIYNTNLSDNDRNLVKNYLATKYNITVV